MLGQLTDSHHHTVLNFGVRTKSAHTIVLKILDLYIHLQYQLFQKNPHRFNYPVNYRNINDFAIKYYTTELNF